MRIVKATPWQRLCWRLAALCGLLALVSVGEANIAGSLLAAGGWGALGKLRMAPCPDCRDDHLEP